MLWSKGKVCPVPATNMYHGRPICHLHWDRLTKGKAWPWASDQTDTRPTAPAMCPEKTWPHDQVAKLLLALNQAQAALKVKAAADCCPLIANLPSPPNKLCPMPQSGERPFIGCQCPRTDGGECGNRGRHLVNGRHVCSHHNHYGRFQVNLRERRDWGGR